MVEGAAGDWAEEGEVGGGAHCVGWGCEGWVVDEEEVGEEVL